MKKLYAGVKAKRVKVKLNTELVNREQAWVSDFHFLVVDSFDEHQLLRFLSDVLRKSGYCYDAIEIVPSGVVDKNRLFSRRRMEGCIEGSKDYCDYLTERYCSTQTE